MSFLPFADSMFNATVTIRRVASTVGARGGISSTPEAGTEYRAIVAPAKMSAMDGMGGIGIPASSTPYDVYVAYDADDDLIPELITGDEVQWGNKHLIVKGPADNYNDEGVLWWIQTWAVQ